MEHYSVNETTNNQSILNISPLCTHGRKRRRNREEPYPGITIERNFDFTNLFIQYNHS